MGSESEESESSGFGGQRLGQDVVNLKTSEKFLLVGVTVRRHIELFSFHADFQNAAQPGAAAGHAFCLSVMRTTIMASSGLSPAGFRPEPGRLPPQLGCLSVFCEAASFRAAAFLRGPKMTSGIQNLSFFAGKRRFDLIIRIVGIG